MDLPALRPTSADERQPLNLVQLGQNLLLLILWLWLYAPLFPYLRIIFSAEDFRTNQVLLLGVAALLLVQARREGARLRPDAPLRPAPLPLALALGGSAAFLLVERFLDVNTLSGVLFGLATYGLLGLWLAPQRWRRGLPAALLLIGTLPFGHHLQTFVGYPMRILTAALVRDGLGAAGVHSLGIETILVFENGVSQIDVPCSGIKSLWTGALFLLAATWIERRPLTLRWLLTALLFSLLLFVANALRVGILVTVGEVWGLRLLAEMLHVPLGVLAFAGACAVALSLLRWQPALPPLAGPAEEHMALPQQRRRLYTVGLMAIVALMALVYSPRPQTGLSTPPPGWAFPAGLQTELLPLKPDEEAWLTRDGADSADRRRFTWGSLSGSMILITSRTWRAHHRPERCFEVYGLSIDNSTTHLLAPDRPIRVVDLGSQQQLPPLAAAYWFQSATLTTDDYGTRIWADLAPRRDRWVLVSVLFDGAPSMDDPEVVAFFDALHGAVQAGIGE